MKFSFCFLFICFFSLNIFAQNVPSMLREAERLELLPEEQSAFNKFREVLRVDPNNLIALTKSSELACRIGAREKQNTELRDKYYAEGLVYGRKAIALYPNNDEANVAIAFALGRTIIRKSGREKVSAAKDLKTYAERAIDLNGRNAKAWLILAIWNFEVSNLTSLERGMAKIMYGGIPPASLKNAITYFEKSKSLNPTFAFTYLELAKAYRRNNENAKAITNLKQILTLPNRTGDDPRIKTEAQQLILKIQQS